MRCQGNSTPRFGGPLSFTLTGKCHSQSPNILLAGPIRGPNLLGATFCFQIQDHQTSYVWVASEMGIKRQISARFGPGVVSKINTFQIFAPIFIKSHIKEAAFPWCFGAASGKTPTRVDFANRSRKIFLNCSWLLIARSVRVESVRPLGVFWNVWCRGAVSRCASGNGIAVRIAALG